jgi:uncharacterized repeat protein (TIGR03943 family)
VSREIQALVLALLGAATLRISVTDAFLAYVREPMRPLLIASGALLLGLAAWSLWRVSGQVERVQDDEAAGHADRQDGHDHHGPGVAWLLLLPVLAIFLVAPPPLGVEAAARDTGVIATEPAGWPDLPPGEPVEIGLDEFAARSYDESGRATLQERRVLLVGFASPAERDGWYLTRFLAQCCAADAAAVKVEVRAQPSPGDGQWVEVVGRYREASRVPDDPGEARIPVLEAQQVTPIDEPRVPYL